MNTMRVMMRYKMIREILFDAGERLKREAKLCDEDMCICDGHYINCKFQRKLIKVEVFQFDEIYLRSALMTSRSRQRESYSQRIQNQA